MQQATYGVPKHLGAEMVCLGDILIDGSDDEAEHEVEKDKAYPYLDDWGVENPHYLLLDRILKAKCMRRFLFPLCLRTSYTCSLGWTQNGESRGRSCRCMAGPC